MQTFHYTFEPQAIPEVILITPRIWPDARGFFMENYTRKEFAEGGIDIEFVQDNTVRSSRGILRGMHATKHPHPLHKLLRCLDGEIFDVAVDLRKNSPTYGKWVGAKLTGDNMQMLYVPVGFAHGYQVLSETALVHYKQTDYYFPELDLGVRYNDPTVGIQWPLDEFSVNDRDAGWPDFGSIEYGF